MGMHIVNKCIAKLGMIALIYTWIRTITYNTLVCFLDTGTNNNVRVCVCVRVCVRACVRACVGVCV